MTIDAPDGQATVVNANQLLGTLTATDTNVTVTPPANCPGMLIITDDSSVNIVTVIGATTGLSYPCILVPNRDGGGNTIVLVMLSTAVDSSFVVTLSGWTTQYSAAKLLTYYGSSSMVFDANLASVIDFNVNSSSGRLAVGGVTSSGSTTVPIQQDSNGNQIVAAGVDSSGVTHQLLTDSTGKLITSSGGGMKEYESFLASNTSISINNATELASVALPIGNGLIIARANFLCNVASGSYVTAWIGTSSSSTTGAYAGVTILGGNASGTEQVTEIVVTRAISITAATTVYLNIEMVESGTVYANSTHLGLPNATGITVLWSA